MSEWQSDRIEELENELVAAKDYYKSGSDSQVEIINEQTTRIAELDDQLRREREAHAETKRELGDAIRFRNTDEQAQVAQLQATHEREVLEVIDQRDAAEDALSQAYFLVTGRSPEWSNLFGHQHALEDLDDAQKTLRITVAQLQATISWQAAEIERLKQFEWMYKDLCK